VSRQMRVPETPAAHLHTDVRHRRMTPIAGQ
jgi:hypothetical protein